MAKILVIDNEERMCKIIKTALEMENHSVDMEFSGKSAVNLLESGKKSYDLFDHFRLTLENIFNGVEHFRGLLCDLGKNEILIIQH